MFDNILQTIGNTPIVKLNRVLSNTPANVYAKCEFFNPGGSIKDRIGHWLLEDAEKKGLLTPGGTIVESTSGNTGFGLAIAAALKGYKSVFVLPDKMSKEKIMNLRAFGARVVVTPTAVEPEDPRSYYSVSKRLAQEIPNAFYVNQYNNLANRECHYRTTGPEILRQMPDIDVLIAGIGTGGTICGSGRYLKKNKKDIEIVAVDPVGSIVHEVFKTGENKTSASTYMIEGIGEDFIPDNYDFAQIDDVVQVEDKESFLMTRRLLNDEGIFVGMSSGSAVIGAQRWIQAQGERLKGKNVLVILPDGGNRYLSKVFNDSWMTENGYFDKPANTVKDLLESLRKSEEKILFALQHQKISEVIEMMSNAGISQMPVKDKSGWIKGLIDEKSLLKAIVQQKVDVDLPIDEWVDTSIDFVSMNQSIDVLSQLMTQGKTPLVEHETQDGELAAIITHIDVLQYLRHQKQL